MAKAWGKEHVDEFIRFVVPPGKERPKGFCGNGFGHITYDEAVELALQLGEDGKLLLEALREMARETLFDERVAVKELAAV
jgi:hypothetical protein